VENPTLHSIFYRFAGQNPCKITRTHASVGLGWHMKIKQTVLPAEMVDMHNTDLYKYKDKSIYSNTGWWYTYPSEKYEFVSWDDEIPNMMGKIKNVPNHQPEYVAYAYFSPIFAYIEQPTGSGYISPAGSPATPLGFKRGPAMPLTTAPQGEADHAALPWKWGP